MSKTKSFDPVLGRIPSGIFLLTVGTGPRATGMLSSWVMQAGFDPPMVSVAVKLGRYVCDWLSEGQPFVLNVLAQSQAKMMKHFSKGFEPGEPAFEGLEISHCARGVPILKESLGHLECEPVRHIDSGDHRVFLANVVRGKLHDANAKPRVHIRNSGATY
ncbi:MAG TPA: flavin reductase family protein [Lacipirellulaceae bacterium]|jgi:flavin reductase (DIM6/NTAB) family NADH-FMN oxidoreductase RutF|nr:flavin reductase family protein [Lacipirellulaceae bacterium]